MKKQITAAMMILTMIATPVMANSMDNPAFENQVFHTQADTPMQLAELSQKEMKETEGAWVALAWRGVTVMSRGFTHIIKGSKLSQGQAVNVLRNGGNVITNNQRYSAKLAQNAWGKNNVIRHDAHSTHKSYMPHYQHKSSKVTGHTFYRK